MAGVSLTMPGAGLGVEGASLGLEGVWIAMCVELCFRGLIFLVRLKRERWMKEV